MHQGRTALPDRCSAFIASDMSNMVRRGTVMKGAGKDWSDRGHDNIKIRTLQPERGKLLIRSTILLIAYYWSSSHVTFI